MENAQVHRYDDLMKNTLREKYPKPLIIFAPMAGLSSPELRQFIFDTGAIDHEWTPFIRLNNNSIPDKIIKREFQYCPCKTYSRLQIMANQEEAVKKGLISANKIGFSTIDINAGCPSPMINRKGAGAILLKDIPKLLDIIRAAKDSFQGSISVKIRSGFDKIINPGFLCNEIAKAGADLIVIHPRLAVHGYKGEADWLYIKEAVLASPVPIIGNGDIVSAENATYRLEQTGCHGIMIGRGLIKNPWLGIQIKKLCNNEKALKVSGLMLRNYLIEIGDRLLLRLKSEKMTRDRLIPHCRLVSYGLEEKEIWCLKAKRSKSLEELFSIIEELKETKLMDWPMPFAPF